MSATSIDLSQIKTDALSAASTFRTLIGLGTSDTPTFKAATLSAGTLNGTVLDVSQTWGGTGTYTGMRYNVTDSGPANAASLLMDFQVGGTSKISIRKTGAIVFGGSDGTSIDPAIVFPTGYSSTFKIATDINNGIAIVAQGYTTYVGNSIKVAADTSVALRWTLGAATKLAMHYDADNTLAQRNAGNAQAFRLYRTYSDGSNYAFTAAKQDATTGYILDSVNLGSPAAPTNLLDLQLNGVSQFRVSSAGDAWLRNLTNSGTIYANYIRAYSLYVINGLGVQVGYIQANTPYFLGDQQQVTGSSSTEMIGLTGTWNTTGTPTAIKLNVTDTASNAASLLMDLQVGGSSRFKVDKAGAINAVGGTLTGNLTILGSSLWVGGSYAIAIGDAGNGYYGGWMANNYLALSPNTVFGWNSGDGVTTKDLILRRDAAGILAQRNGTNAQTFRIYNTTDAGLNNYERAKIAWESNVLRIGTEGLGTGASNPRAMEFQTDGTTRLTVESGGLVQSTRMLCGTGVTQYTTYPLTVNGNIMLRFTGATSSNTNDRAFMGKLSDWLGGSNNESFCFSAYTAETHFFVNNQYLPGDQALILRASEVVLGKNTTCNGNLTLSTKNLVTDTTTGTKIGTATTQKLGFYNASPVVQPAAVSDATDAASVITQLNLLLARMRDLGLIAT